MNIQGQEKRLERPSTKARGNQQGVEVGEAGGGEEEGDGRLKQEEEGQSRGGAGSKRQEAKNRKAEQCDRNNDRNFNKKFQGQKKEE